MNSSVSPSRLSLDAVRPQFESLLRAANVVPASPALGATWRAFAEFARTEVACDDESLFFECGPSPSDESRFYVNFTRTFFGRDAGNHFWSSELNCDFLLESDEILEELGATIEAEELADSPAGRATFFRQVNAQKALWSAMEKREVLAATIYFGES